MEEEEEVSTQDPLKDNMAHRCTCPRAPARKEDNHAGTEDAPTGGALETRTTWLLPHWPQECESIKPGA